MRGVQFVVDRTGRKTGVVIDLRKNPELRAFLGARDGGFA